MATQNDRIRILLTEALARYDTTAAVTPGSRAYETIVGPVMTALGVDPIDTDIEAFLKTRLRQEYPTLAVEDGDALVDLMIRPLQLLLEAFKRELELVRIGQSLENVNAMRGEDVDALAANFFVARRLGTQASGTVRIYYSNPTYVVITPSTQFTTLSGLVFSSPAVQQITADRMALQRSGAYYYLDVSVRAAAAGAQYNIGEGEIVRITNLTGFVRVTNLAAFLNGVDTETSAALAARTRTALTERSLNTRRGIEARINELFPAVSAIEVVGYGDPEMDRDVLTGTSDGKVVASGTCFLVGSFCLMLSQYENRGSAGRTQIAVGDVVGLNYWNLLYDLPEEERNEDIAIADIVFDSRDTLSALPSILLFRLERPPAPVRSRLGTLPGTLPGVFCVVKSQASLTISGMPGGILDPDTARGTVELVSDEVHIGGHYDVWVRASSPTETTQTLGPLATESAVLENTTLSTFGAETAGRNRVSCAYALHISGLTAALTLGAAFTGQTSGATAILAGATMRGTRGTLILRSVVGTFTNGEQVVHDTAPSVSFTVDTQAGTFATAGVRVGMVLQVLSGTDAGTYRILAVDAEGVVYLDTELTATESDLHFRVIDEVTLDAFAAKALKFPFGAEATATLRTIVGSDRVYAGVDLASYGVVSGDTLEILEGPDQGLYAIRGFDPVLGSVAPLLALSLSSTNSGVPFRIYRAQSSLQRPLVRIQPDGVRLLDSASQNTGIQVPYALPVGAFAQGAFSHATPLAEGMNGFVLPDPGPTWAPSADLVASRAEFPDAIDVFSDEYLPKDGVIVCATLLSNGTFYLNGNFPPQVQAFYQQLQTWLLNVADQFEMGPDVKAFFNGLVPLKFGAPANVLEFIGNGTYAVGETVEIYNTATELVGTATIASAEILLDVLSTAGISDGDTVVCAATGATATVRVYATGVLLLSNHTGVFSIGDTISNGTTTLIVNEVRGQLTLSEATLPLESGQTLRGSAGAEAEIDVMASTVLQFELCLPYEMFDGCNNVFLTLPEFDWEVLLDSADSFADAVGLYATGQLAGPPPALAQAKPGDALTLSTGANAGDYTIHRVLHYRLGTAAAILGGEASYARCYPVVAAVIDGEFPVAPFGGMEEFFSAGVPDLARLPSAPDFPGVSYDATGVAQSPWEWVGLFLDWLLRVLNELGFDLPEELDLDPAETLRALWSLLFTEYTVGRRTAEQTLRTYFLEPTTVEVYAPRPCFSFLDETLVLTPATATVTPTLPITGLVGATARLVVRGLRGTQELEAVLPDTAGSALLNVAGLGAIFQEALDPDETYVLFSAIDTELVLTTVETGHDVRLHLDATDPTGAFALLGFVDGMTTSAGTTASGGTALRTVVTPPAASVFVLPEGAETVPFVPAERVAPLRVVPVPVPNEEDPPALPRDARITTVDYAGQATLQVSFSDESYDAPLVDGVRAGDLLRVYEQRQLLLAVAPAHLDAVDERMPAVQTTVGSALVRLPSTSTPAFTFWAPEMTYRDEGAPDPLLDRVHVGDLLYLEEGDDAGTYRVVGRPSATELLLDRPLTASSGTVYASDNTGTILADTQTFTVSTADARGPFYAAPLGGGSWVGKYLTLWASGYRGVNGSYAITAVSTDGKTLTVASTDPFPVDEGALHWAVVRAPASTPSASALEGLTELVGVRPFRVYNGRGKEWPIAAVSTSSERLTATLRLSIEGPVLHEGMPDVDELGPRPPRPGRQFPYAVVRPGVQRITATQMQTQRDSGFYYFDLRARSRGGTAAANIPAGARLEPVFGTYRSDGYRYEVVDAKFSFSPYEQLRLVFTPTILPIGATDRESNRIPLVGRSLQVTGEVAPVVAQVQRLLMSETDRVLCANPLARHFLPGYVSLAAAYEGGDTPDEIVKELQAYIAALRPTEMLDVSQMERFFHQGGALRYDHPIFVFLLVHDRDRRLVLSRSDTRLGGVIDYNGSNRITAFLPGEDRSGNVSPPPGELIDLRRGVPTTSLR